jgi:hypothetical protein
MPKGVRLKPEQIVAKLREIEVKMGQGKDVLTVNRPGFCGGSNL